MCPPSSPPGCTVWPSGQQGPTSHLLQHLHWSGEITCKRMKEVQDLLSFWPLPGADIWLTNTNFSDRFQIRNWAVTCQSAEVWKLNRNLSVLSLLHLTVNMACPVPSKWADLPQSVIITGGRADSFLKPREVKGIIIIATRFSYTLAYEAENTKTFCNV